MIVVVNRLEEAIIARDRDALTKAFVLLNVFMDIHFRNEEKIAEAVNFPFAKNKMEHWQLHYEMRYTIQKLESTHNFWSDHLLQKYSRFLTGWMTDHIIKTDMQMKPALLAYPYNFKPD